MYARKKLIGTPPLKGLHMHATDIVAYTYQAETLCPSCTVASYTELPIQMVDVNVEQYLDDAARLFGIDRMDERSFDSSEFPKVVFASQVDGYERFEDAACMGCGEELI